MKTAADPQLSPDVAKTHQQRMPSPTAVSEVLSNAARHIQLIQSHAGTTLFARSMENFLSALSPRHAPYWLQQLPLHYRRQATTLMAAVADTFSEGMQAQQTLMELGRQSFLPSAQALADSSSATPNTAHRRRLSRQEIQFPNRRVA
jgi:hypothetical protein